MGTSQNAFMRLYENKNRGGKKIGERRDIIQFVIITDTFNDY